MPAAAYFPLPNLLATPQSAGLSSQLISTPQPHSAPNFPTVVRGSDGVDAVIFPEGVVRRVVEDIYACGGIAFKFLGSSALLFHQEETPHLPPPFKAAIFVCGGASLSVLASNLFPQFVLGEPAI
jgi:hypothetical protein